MFKVSAQTQEVLSGMKLTQKSSLQSFDVEHGAHQSASARGQQSGKGHCGRAHGKGRYYGERSWGNYSKTQKHNNKEKKVVNAGLSKNTNAKVYRRNKAEEISKLKTGEIAVSSERQATDSQIIYQDTPSKLSAATSKKAQKSNRSSRQDGDECAKHTKADYNNGAATETKLPSKPQKPDLQDKVINKACTEERNVNTEGSSSSTEEQRRTSKKPLCKSKQGELKEHRPRQDRKEGESKHNDAKTEGDLAAECAFNRRPASKLKHHEKDIRNQNATRNQTSQHNPDTATVIRKDAYQVGNSLELSEQHEKRPLSFRGRGRGQRRTPNQSEHNRGKNTETDIKRENVYTPKKTETETCLKQKLDNLVISGESEGKLLRPPPGFEKSSPGGSTMQVSSAGRLPPGFNISS